MNVRNTFKSRDTEDWLTTAWRPRCMHESFLGKPHLQALSQSGSASHVCLVLALWDAHSQLWFFFSVRNIPVAGAWGRNAPGSSGMNNWREEDPSSWSINKRMRLAPERINTASKAAGRSCAGILFSQLGMKWHTQVQRGGAGCTRAKCTKAAAKAPLSSGWHFLWGAQLTLTAAQSWVPVCPH